MSVFDIAQTTGGDEAEPAELVQRLTGDDPAGMLDAMTDYLTGNGWTEPNREGATSTLNPKDSVEDDLHRAVCTGRVTLAAAQQAIATDWTTAEQTLGLTH